jgi:Spermine/spermidine synthase domain
MAEPLLGTRRMKGEMFALSFTALFLEMMVIRWVPSVLHLVAYYANLMLLSSFLGLGAGAITAGRKWKLFGWFPLFLACDIALLLFDRNSVLATSASEEHFFALPPSMLQAFVLVRIFAMNALLFVPLGQRMGILFNSLPRLTAYAWDLAGSLCGTLCFGIFSLKLFSPVLGMAGVMAIYLILSGRRRWLIDIPVLAAAIVMIVMNTDPKAIWSPYYYITINKFETPNITESAPPPQALKGRDPPIYLVRVNQFGYHYDAALDSRLYTPGTKGAEYIRWIELEHKVPYAVADSCDNILVVGAGGGFDVEAALECGTKHVDAVEIDPAIIDISRHFNAGAPYSDPRVSIHIDDARSFMAKAKPGYDMVVFGFLDSQALFSTMSNVRLDGYVYTIESLRSAFRLLNDHGMLTLSFFLGRPWLGPKLYELVAEATGRTPAMYLDTGGRGLILCVPKDPATVLPRKVFQYTRAAYSPLPRIDLPTDDWPFLYLIKKTVPSDYLIAIASLLAFSIATIAWLRGRSFGSGDVHFGLLGMGFLLLETKGISDSTLFFGATWFVTMLVVTGVLLMVMGANLVAERIPRFSLWMYAPLFAILAVLLIVPRESVLQYDFAGRLMWTLLVVPLPVFFAGVIFSTTFRETAVPSSVFGANLIGAMIGGFCEYLGMAVGNHRLSLLVAVAYLGSLLVVANARSRGRPL